MSWINSVGNFFKNLFSSKTGAAILNGIKKAAPYINEAIQLATIAAGFIGGPAGATVAGVLAFAEKYGIEAVVKPGATDAEIKTAIRDAVVAVLRLKFPDASASDLNRAVELAVGSLKS